MSHLSFVELGKYIAKIGRGYVNEQKLSADEFLSKLNGPDWCEKHQVYLQSAILSELIQLNKQMTKISPGLKILGDIAKRLERERKQEAKSKKVKINDKKIEQPREPSHRRRAAG